MRKIGMITDIETDTNYLGIPNPSNPAISTIWITIWNSKTKSLQELKIVKFDRTHNYMIGYYVEYDEETNQIVPITNINYTKEENEEMFKIFSEKISEPKVYSAFCNQMDKVEGKVPIPSDESPNTMSYKR